MREGVLSARPEAEVAIVERCLILELSTAPDDAAMSIARARVAPGVTTRWHALRGTDERYVIIAGRGVVEVGHRPPEPVEPWDVVLIPAGVRQRLTNTGDDDLVFLSVCDPPFAPPAYEDLEGGAQWEATGPAGG